jgi:hypothetical protein
MFVAAAARSRSIPMEKRNLDLAFRMDDLLAFFR